MLWFKTLQAVERILKKTSVNFDFIKFTKFRQFDKTKKIEPNLYRDAKRLSLKVISHANIYASQHSFPPIPHPTHLPCRDPLALATSLCTGTPDMDMFKLIQVEPHCTVDPWTCSNLLNLDITAEGPPCSRTCSNFFVMKHLWLVSGWLASYGNAFF